MPQFQINGMKIAGISATVPSKRIAIEEEESLSGIDDLRLKRLKKNIGMSQRHVCIQDECASDLCEHAARSLLAEKGIDSKTIDCLFMVTSTPDFFQPATSCVLHGKLNLRKDCAAFDVNLACSGYIYGLWLSSMMISTGSCNRVLMLVGDTISRCVSPKDGGTAPLFGDGGSATILEKGAENEIISFDLQSNGNDYDKLFIPAGGFRKRSTENTAKMIKREDGYERSDEHLYMNGAEIFSFTLKEIPSSVQNVLKISSWKIDDIDYFIFHQANKFIVKNLAKRLNVPVEKAPSNVFEKYGNQSSASIPVTICESLSIIPKSNTKKLILSAFGSGLSWAACALSINSKDCLPVQLMQ